MTNKKELKGRAILGGKYRDKHHKEVSEYIHRMLRQGHHEKDVKKALLFVGWPKDFVEKELVRIKNFLIREKNKIEKYLLGRLLFIVILFMMIVVYILLIFNKVFIGTNYSRFVFVYIIFSLLLVSWVILLHPLIAHAKRLYEIKRDIKEHEKVRMLLEKRKIMPLQHQAELEKERKKAEKLKLKEEKKRIKEQRRMMKEKEREARLILRKERGVFSKFFIRKTKEEKKELKPEKEEIPAVKREEKKAPYKKVGIERKKLRIFYFILFLSFIVSAVVASAWNMISAVVALVLAIVFLVVFIKTRKPKEEIAVVKEKPKEEIAEKEKAMVKELPKGPIELGRYETDLDALYKLIEQRGAIRLSTIAKYFGINKKKAEEWATILQDHNLAEIRYPAIGEPELAKFGLSRKEIKALLRQQKLIAKKSKEERENLKQIFSSLVKF